jgi:hypothetical protein
MESQPYAMVQKRLTDDYDMSAEELSRVKKKAKINAKLLTRDNTYHHPCNEEDGALTKKYKKLKKK